MTVKEGDEFSLDEFLGNQPFYSGSPPASEVREALLEELAPLHEYRLVWLSSRSDGSDGHDGEGLGSGSCVASGSR